MWGAVQLLGHHTQELCLVLIAHGSNKIKHGFTLQLCLQVVANLSCFPLCLQNFLILFCSHPEVVYLALATLMVAK